MAPPRIAVYAPDGPTHRRYPHMYDTCSCGGPKTKISKLCRACRMEARAAEVPRCSNCTRKLAQPGVLCWRCLNEQRLENAARANRYVERSGKREHRVVMEEVLGRPLRSDEHVHHKNGLKWDNRPENLEVLSPKEHLRAHMRKTDDAVKQLILSGIPGPVLQAMGVSTHRITRLRRELGIPRRHSISRWGW